jgi:hypothetical protein
VKRAVSPHFVIVGMQETNDRVRLMSIGGVRDVQIDEDRDTDDVHQFGGTSITRSLLRDNDMKVTVTAGREGMQQVVAECYPQAWTRLLDLWVPPDFTDTTRSQVLSHFTFNDPASPADRFGLQMPQGWAWQ